MIVNDMPSEGLLMNIIIESLKWGSAVIKRRNSVLLGGIIWCSGSNWSLKLCTRCEMLNFNLYEEFMLRWNYQSELHYIDLKFWSPLMPDVSDKMLTFPGQTWILAVNTSYQPGAGIPTLKRLHDLCLFGFLPAYHSMGYTIPITNTSGNIIYT